MLRETIHQFFDEQGWRTYADTESGDLMMDVSAKGGTYICYARVHDEAEQFVYYVMCPIKVPENKRHAVSEYLSRVNYGIIIGNFELDFRDGEIRYKTSIDTEGGTLSSAQVKTCVFIGISMMDRYLPGLMAILYNNTLPEDAIAKIEGDDYL